MSVKIEGIGKLRSNFYDKLVIREEQGYGTYRVNVDGKKINHATEVVGDRFSDDFKELGDINKIKLIVEDFVSNTKICGITDLIALPRYGGHKFNVVYGNFGYKEMLLQLFNGSFRDTYKMIQDKYQQDRFDFCYEERGVKTFKISTSNTSSAYTLDLDKLHNCAKDVEYFKHIMLKEKGFKITDDEKKFISDFVINVFSKFGDEISVEKVYNTEYEFTSHEVLGYMLKCGNVKIYLPKYQPLLFILNLVSDYNLNVKKEKDKCMKRQLRMEEF